ncbi:hypothetical protein [Nocardia amamiensis]|uniref:hypothetical protein n=1 Tax=Nocardia amamiensis TaxID=404578 RepID=UPI00082ECC0D|nr:hypothetical protein [Nocardia amamiensis]
MLSIVFAGVAILAGFDPERDRLQRDVRTVWGCGVGAGFNAERVGVCGVLNDFRARERVGGAAAVLDGLGCGLQPTPEHRRPLPWCWTPGRDGAHCRLDDIDACSAIWASGAGELATRLAAAVQPAPAGVAGLG